MNKHSYLIFPMCPDYLKLVTEVIFVPFSNEEFIEQDNGTYKRNKFKPS